MSTYLIIVIIAAVFALMGVNHYSANNLDKAQKSVFGIYYTCSNSFDRNILLFFQKY